MVYKGKEYEYLFYHVLNLAQSGCKIDENYIVSKYHRTLECAKEVIRDIDTYIDGIETNILLETIWSWNKEYVTKEYISLRLGIPLFLAEILHDMYLNTEEYNITLHFEEGELLLGAQ